jgi:hypothetical protein
MSKIVSPAKLTALVAGALLLLPAGASAYNYAPSNAPRHSSGGTYYYSDTSSYGGRGYSSCCRSRGTVVYDDYGAHYLGGGRYYGSCGCYRGYYTGYRHDGYGADLYDYSAQVYDDRAHLDRRTPYEYRWPRRNY